MVKSISNVEIFLELKFGLLHEVFHEETNAFTKNFMRYNIFLKKYYFSKIGHSMKIMQIKFEVIDDAESLLIVNSL